MAGVYIKGMDKPKECRDCPFNIGVCIVKVAVFGKELLHAPGEGWCPIEAVPDHGDLIKRDEMAHEVWCKHCYECEPGEIEEHCESCVVKGVEKTRSKWLDTLENALVRAESARKDIDLILVMRAVRDMLEEEVRIDGKQQKIGDGV